MNSQGYEQTYRNSCVPACMCILQLWRGEATTEERFHEGATNDGHDLGRTLMLDRVRTMVLGVGEEEEIDLALRCGCLVVAMLSGPPQVAWFAARYPEASSRHGRLCGPGAPGKPYHAIVLTERLDDGYRYHDPWYPADKPQHFTMSEDDFQRCFGGRIAVAEP